VNEAFGFWLSGITDGEGCFLIELQKPNKHQPHVKYRGSFAIALRADDVYILNQIKVTLGFGHVYPKPRSAKVKNSKPQFVYRVSSIENCCELVNLFDKYQLQSKKLNDYKVWKEFILYKKQHFGNFDNTIDYINTLETFYKQLKTVREFPKR